MRVNIECPINSLSLGQVSIGVLRELYHRGIDVNLFPINSQIDVSSQKDEPEFFNWLHQSAATAANNYKYNLPSLTIWHLNGAFKTFPGDSRVLWTAHETDEITDVESNICDAYSKVLVTSKYSEKIFARKGVDVAWCPNFFDSNSFYKKEIKKQEGVTNFLLCGKIEQRKLTKEIISLWAAMFGSNPKYRLNCLIDNPFLNPGQTEAIVNSLFKGERPWNINLIHFQEKNETVNDLINFCDIDISGLSGAEGWNLPAFNAICLGKTAIVMNEHAHKSFANEENSILVEPGEKTEIYDGMFFKKGLPFNQGNMYSMNYKSAEKALLKAVSGEFVNTKGDELAQKFSVSKTVDIILQELILV